jgi:hypothetical protein
MPEYALLMYHRVEGGRGIELSRNAVERAELESRLASLTG